MRSFDEWLEAQLTGLRRAGLYRCLRRLDSSQGPRVVVEGRSLLNFASNDYLDLATHPRVVDAAQRAGRSRGAGAGASRLLSGSLDTHHELETKLAAFKGTEAAITFSSGYATALGAVPALVGKGDVVVLDRLVHACLVDAARLSGARLRVFRHNNLADLERVLRWARAQVGDGNILVVTESVFSMDGDLADLEGIVELKERHGAWLLLDEAHATGLYGARHSGLAEARGVTERIEIQLVTLGKALGAAGGAVVGSRRLIDFLINRARSLIFSTAPSPGSTAAATAALEVLESDEGANRVAQLWRNVDSLRQRLTEAGFHVPPDLSPILPVWLGEESRAVEAADRLRDAGLFVPAIRYPTVGRGQARLRLTVSTAHSEDHLGCLAHALERFAKPAYESARPA